MVLTWEGGRCCGKWRVVVWREGGWPVVGAETA